MQKKNNIKFSVTGLAAYILTRAILNSIGIDNIPISITLVLFIGIPTVFIIKMIKKKETGFRKVYNLLFIVFAIVISSGVIFGEVTSRYYPNVFLHYKEPVKIFLVVSFIIFGALIIILKQILERNTK